EPFVPQISLTGRTSLHKEELNDRIRSYRIERPIRIARHGICRANSARHQGTWPSSHRVSAAEWSVCGAQDDESTTTFDGCRRHLAGRRLLTARARHYSSRADPGSSGIGHQQFGRHNYTAKYESD